VTPPNLWKSFADPKTKVFRAADGENLLILACTVLTDPLVWQTGRRTDRIAMAKTRNNDKHNFEFHRWLGGIAVSDLRTRLSGYGRLCMTSGRVAKTGYYVDGWLSADT